MSQIDTKTRTETQQGNPAQSCVRELADHGACEKALEALHRSADSGDLAAMTLLGLRLLVGRDAPFDPPQALALLKSAAASGDADALAQMATLNATGAWIPKNWTAALDLLQTAAERGSASAQGQLLILAGNREFAGGGGSGDQDNAGTWRRLRQRVSLEHWFAAPARRAVCEAPRIRIVDTFVPSEACDWLVERSRGRFARSMMFDGRKSNFLATRTCSDFKFDITDADLVLQALRERISAITTLPIAGFEPPQIFHYALGEEIKAHYDALRAGDQSYGVDGSYRGDRIATFLLYLNDDYGGGELEFPKVGLRHKGKKGDGVYFAHVNPDGQRDPLSLHAGLPVTRNEKFILSQWIHDRPFAATL